MIHILHIPHPRPIFDPSVKSLYSIGNNMFCLLLNCMMLDSFDMSTSHENLGIF